MFGYKDGFMPSVLGFNSWGSIISMILFWILIIIGIIYLVRYLPKTDRREGEKKPLDILKERYARGEINKEEFEEKKKDLI
jgi:putative membrane protein